MLPGELEIFLHSHRDIHGNIQKFKNVVYCLCKSIIFWKTTCQLNQNGMSEYWLQLDSGLEKMRMVSMFILKYTNNNVCKADIELGVSEKFHQLF